MSTVGIPGRDVEPLVRRAADQTISTASPDVSHRYRTPVDAAAIVRRLVAIDGAGWGTTAATPLPTRRRDASKAKSAAMLSAVPAGEGGLVAAYAAYKERERAVEALKAGHDAAFDREARALRKSRKRVLKKVRQGRSAERALDCGFFKYLREGGARFDYPGWAEKVAAP